MNGQNGFKQTQQPSRKEKLAAIQTELKNSQMAARISQMMTQQIMQNIQNLSQDLGKALGLINELQYKILAVQKVAGLDTAALADIANELRLKDFNEASDKEDQEQNFTVGGVIGENSTVILTSTTPGNDAGIFRSKIKLSECGVPDLIAAFMGKEAGAKATIKLNGMDHEIEILGVRQPPPAIEVELKPEEVLPSQEVVIPANV